GMYEAAEAMGQLAERTGATVEQLSQVRDAATITGRSFESMQGSFDRLNKSASAATDPLSKQAAAFRALGVEIMNTDGTVKDSGTLMLEVAKAQEQFADGANKAAILMEIGGKQMAANIP